MYSALLKVYILSQVTLPHILNTLWITTDYHPPHCQGSLTPYHHGCPSDRTVGMSVTAPLILSGGWSRCYAVVSESLRIWSRSSHYDDFLHFLIINRDQPLYFSIISAGFELALSQSFSDPSIGPCTESWAVSSSKLVSQRAPGKDRRIPPPQWAMFYYPWGLQKLCFVSLWSEV